MKIFFWTYFIHGKKGFPRENGKPYIPSSSIQEGIKSAAIYYYIKKDKQIENLVKKYLLKEKLSPVTIVKDIEDIIYQKYPFLKELILPEKIFLPSNEVKEKQIEVIDLNTWLDVEEFKVEVFKGVIEIEGQCEELQRLKAISHSFTEALAKMEHSMLKEHPLAKKFYEPLLNRIKTWEIPLRLGWWTETKFKGNLLFFWRIKEVRENLKKFLQEDIKPSRIIYFPREIETPGWVEIKP